VLFVFIITCASSSQRHKSWNDPMGLTTETKPGKRRLTFASFTTEECLNFPAASHSHVDSITHINFMTGKLSA
jgi:hypothetical protein